MLHMQIHIHVHTHYYIPTVLKVNILGPCDAKPTANVHTAGQNHTEKISLDVSDSLHSFIAEEEESTEMGHDLGDFPGCHYNYIHTYIRHLLVVLLSIVLMKSWRFDRSGPGP